MKLAATLNRENQITLPEEVRRRLGVEGGDTVMFDITETDIRLKGREMTLDEILAAPLRLPGPATDDFDKEIEEAMEIELREKYARIFKGE